MRTTGRLNPRVDVYLAKAQPFAVPILRHLRALVHRACPEIEETIKWSRPFFEYRGTILCNMSAFRQHCSFGFWGQEIAAVLREADVLAKDGMGSFGRLRTLADLPADENLVAWVRLSAGFIDSGQHTGPAARNRVAKAAPPLLETPAEFKQALARNPQAAKIFASFSPSSRREYLEWIAAARREETRAQRIHTALEWIAEGKRRNWKYQSG